MAGIGIITNPNAKSNKLNPEQQELLAYIAGDVGHQEITHDLKALSRSAEYFRRKDIDILAINGGDGTVNRTINAFIQAYKGKKLPAIALLRGGTVNILAKNLGFRGTPTQRLASLINRYATNNLEKPISIKTLCANKSYGFLFGNGVCTSFLQEFYKKKTNQLGALKLFAKIYGSALIGRKSAQDLLRHQPYLAAINGSNKKATVGSFAVLCSTIDALPLGIKLFPGALAMSSGFRCFYFTQSTKSFLRQVPISAVRPERMISKNIHFNCQRLHLTALKPTILSSMDYTIDGELYQAPSGSVTIHCGPEITMLRI